MGLWFSLTEIHNCKNDIIVGKQKINQIEKIQSEGSDFVPFLFLQIHSLYFSEGTRKKGNIKMKQTNNKEKI